MSSDRDNGATISKEQQQQQLHQQVRVRLMNERPTMDQALKSFASWMMVHTTTSSNNTNATASEGELSWTTADVLKMTRWLSIHINQHIVSIATIVQKQNTQMKQRESSSSSSSNTSSGAADNNDDSTTTRRLLNALVPQIWNELVGQKSKVTKLLGRTSLQIVWADLDLVKQLLEEKRDDDDESWLRKLCIYLQYFERFLFAESTLSTTATAAATIASKSVMLDGQDVVALPFTPDMSDAKLIWDADGGQAELARRASGRQQQAAERRQQMEQQAAAAAAAAASNKQSMKPPPPAATSSSSSSVVITEINEKDETNTKQGGAQEKAE